MSLTIGLSVAELCSSYPTAGGMYVVTKYVVADKAKMPLAAWIVSTDPHHVFETTYSIQRKIRSHKHGDISAMKER